MDGAGGRERAGGRDRRSRHRSRGLACTFLSGWLQFSSVFPPTSYSVPPSVAQPPTQHSHTACMQSLEHMYAHV